MTERVKNNTVSVANVIAIVALTIGLVTSSGSTNERVAKLEEAKAQSEQRLIRIEKDNEKANQINREDHQRIEAKMDLLIEKISKK